MAGFNVLGTMAEDDDLADGMLLDPPDPLDLLIAHTENGIAAKSRPLDFVRVKFQEVKQENKRLKARVADLEQTLSIVQTAQEWTMGRGMTPEQQEKMKEIRTLLEKAKKAREELQNFSGASRQSLYEKLRDTKAALKRERQEKQEMKDRLLIAFDHARSVKEQFRKHSHDRSSEQERWQDLVRDMKERHRRELRRLQGDSSAMEADRQDQLSYFGEQVIDGLSALQQHLGSLRQETVDSVILEGPDEDAEDWLGTTQREAVAGAGQQGGGPVEDDDF